MTQALHPATDRVEPFPSPPSSCWERLARLAPQRLAAIEAYLTLAPHALPPGVVGRGMDLERLQALAQDLVPALVPPALQRASASRQLGHLGGRLCAEAAMAAASGRRVGIGIGESGAPLWPADLVGSISHTRGGAWACVGLRPGWSMVGIDSELLADADAVRSIVELCCTAEERRRWFPQAPDPLLATLLFSAKESVYKAIHPVVRRFVEFDEVELVALDAGRSALRLRPVPGGPLAARFDGFELTAVVAGDQVHTALVAGA
nr:4'-phosphopantetheinyl transferase superfamily protein [uncultured Roseateles sp.]